MALNLTMIGIISGKKAAAGGIELRRPSGDGVISLGTYPAYPVTHYDKVNELIPDEDASYNYSGDAPAIFDLFVDDGVANVYICSPLVTDVWTSLDSGEISINTRTGLAWTYGEIAALQIGLNIRFASDFYILAATAIPPTAIIDYLKLTARVKSVLADSIRVTQFYVEVAWH